jgi:hypothetical protein
MYIIFFFIGIILGILITKLIPKILDAILVKSERKWLVKFHTEFLIHENGQQTNNIVKSPSVEIYVNAKDESEATDLVLEMIQNELRIEIESVDLWLL